MVCCRCQFRRIALQLVAAICRPVVLVTCCWFLFALGSVCADLTIDPDSIGATDVVQNPLGTPILLVNPLSDPMDLGWDDLAVGNDADGALAIENGGFVGSVSSFVGRLAGSSGIVSIDGAGSIWSNTTGTNNSNFFIGDLGDGYLSITGGGAVSNYHNTFIGNESGSTGELIVDGTGSTWTSSGSFNVGYYGIGTVGITNGGAISSDSSRIGRFSGGTGVVSVEGSDSTWEISAGLEVGSSGSGQLEIADGGHVSVDYTTFVALQSGSDGTIDFDNGVLTTGNLIAAASDLTGTGTINSHGLLTDVDLVFDATYGLVQTVNLATNASQNITVNLDVDGTGTLGAGNESTGSMRVADGVVVSSASGYIGYQAGSSGEVTISGVGSGWNAGFLDIGNYGTGVLMISDGGMVSSSSGEIASRPGSSGSVVVDGEGSLWSASNPSIGNSGNGTLHITGGGTLNNSGSTAIGDLTGSVGEVLVDGEGSAWNSAGRLMVAGKGNGVLNITGGGLVKVEDRLWINNGGGGDGSVNMATGGMLALNGEADDSLAHFLNQIFGTDEIRYWDSSIVDWAPITAATIGDDYTLVYHTSGDLAGFTVLTVGAIGDFDGNGDVDGFDFLRWQRGETPHSFSAMELADWEEKFGTGVAAVAAIVPEARTLLLAVVGILVLLPKRR